MTTIGNKRRRYPTADSIHESGDDHEELSNLNPPLTNKRRSSATADLASHHLIVSERRQLAVLKQLTAGDESGSPSSSLIITQQRPTKIHRRNEHGEIILHIAARKGDLKQIKKALNDGANVNEQDNAGWTPLHEAVTKNQFKAAGLLLKSGANSNAPGPDGQTPLIDAVLNNNTKMVGLLLKYSADSSVIDLSRLNETMVKVLQREITTFDLSDHDNDDDSLSPSSPLTSTNDSEHDEDKNEKILLQSTSTYIPKIQRKKTFEHFYEHSSDSLSNNKTCTMDSDLSRKNPYDFESNDDDDDDDDDDETIRNPKRRTTTGSSNDNHEMKNTPSQLFHEQLPDDDEHIQHNYRVPPLRIVLARPVACKNTDIESSHSSTTMDESSTMETLSLPIIEENEKFLSTVITCAELNNKVMTLGNVQEKNDRQQAEEIYISVGNKTPASSNINDNPPESSHMIISMLINDIITQVDINRSIPLTSSDQQEVMEKTKSNELKITTRTLRSHAKGKSNTTMSNQTSNDNRHSSNRRRIPERKSLLSTHEKFQRKKTISERSQYNETSSNSDDQTIENPDEKTDPMDDTYITSGGDDDGRHSNTSTTNVKQIRSHPDIESLPPNKRRLRERNAGLLNSTDATNTNTSSTTEENIPLESTTRDIPINSIKQFLDIRQQIGKRHDAMLHDFVLPKVPKDFAETLMARKTYLIAPSFKSYAITTPASLGIKRHNPPSDLDAHLSDVFARQEDERYRMKLRHQVEREKLILSHEQEILRLYGNATRSSINQDIPFSYCSLMKDNEVYNNPSAQERHASVIYNEYTNTELSKRGKHRWNGRSFIKSVEDSNLKYKRLSCEINQRQHLEANTLYSMQRMVWLKHLPKETPASGRLNSLLSERYLSKVEINTSFWTHWETSPL